MKKKVSLICLGLLCIIALQTFKSISKNNSQVDTNRDFLKKISTISVDKIQEVQITNRSNSTLDINTITKPDDIKKILSAINVLELYKMQGNDSELNVEIALYDIRIIKKGYYPQGAIFITPNSIWYKNKEYYLNRNISDRFKDIFTSMGIQL